MKGYITVGLYSDGKPCEMFLVLADAGEAAKGLARCWATCFSICLQYGAPIETLTEKFKYFRFDPSGWTDNEKIRHVHSIADYVCRWIELTFLAASRGSLPGESQPGPDQNFGEPNPDRNSDAGERRR